MAAELKYYKYTDTNEKLNRTVGVSISCRDPEGLIKEVKGTDGVSKLVIMSENFVEQTNTFKPKDKELTEISKDEYDSIVVSGENVLETINRIKYEQRIQKIYNKFANYVGKTMVDHLKAAAKSTGIVAATAEEAEILLPLAKATPTFILNKAR